MNLDQNLEDDNMKHICNICGKQTLSREKLKQHQNEVHKSKGFKCTEFDQRVKSKKNLSQHIRPVHERVKYPCRQCDHKATSKSHLAEHKRHGHLGSNQMLKNVEFLNQKNENVKKKETFQL